MPETRCATLRDWSSRSPLIDIHREGQLHVFSIKSCVIQYIPRNMHTVFALLCFVVVIHWMIFPYPSGLLHWHCGNLTIAPVPAKQPWWIWINTSCEFIMNDCITTTKQSTTKPCAYFLGYTVHGFSTLRSWPLKQHKHMILPHWEQGPICPTQMTLNIWLLKVRWVEYQPHTNNVVYMSNDYMNYVQPMYVYNHLVLFIIFRNTNFNSYVSNKTINWFYTYTWKQ